MIKKVLFFYFYIDLLVSSTVMEENLLKAYC